MMIRKLFTTIIALPLFFSWLPAQNWNATNLTSVNYLAISDIESYNNELYGLVFTGFTGDFYKLNTDEKSWTKLTPNGIDGYANQLETFNGKLYIASTYLVYSMLYYTTDEGQTVTADTVGLPKSNKGIAPMYGLYAYSDLLIVNLGSAGYWARSIDDPVWYNFIIPTFLNGGGDPINYFNGIVIGYDNSGTHTFYRSSDYGKTFETLTTNLPDYFDPYLTTTDKTTGRFYVAGTIDEELHTGLYYSDDKGTSWQAVDLSAFISTNYLGAPQKITAIFAEGDNISIALENDKSNTAPDVIQSTNGINGFSANSNGLPNDQSGKVYGVKFLKHKENLLISLNVIDVFIQKDSSGEQNAIHELNKGYLTIYPNPVTSTLNINGIENFSKPLAVIYDLNGQEILKQPMSNSIIEVNNLTQGVYTIRIWDDTLLKSTQSFIKR